MKVLFTTLLFCCLLASNADALEVSIDPGAPILAGTGQIALNGQVVQETGAEWVRVNFILGPWTGPNDATLRGPQAMTWKQTYDTIINDLVARGLKVYALVGAEAVKSGTSNLNSDQYVNDYVSNFAIIVNHFKDRVKVYESFNEPNDWAGGTSAQVQPLWFAKMLANIYTTIKPTAPDVTLVSGPLFSHDQDTAATYLGQVYTAGKNQLNWNAIKTAYGSFPLDGIGYHIYVKLGPNSEAAVVQGVNTNLNAIWSTVTSHEGANTTKKLWISEWGWNTQHISESEQARNLTLVFNLHKDDARIYYSNWFQIGDFGTTDKWGLFRAGGLIEANKKPSWQAFRTFALSQAGGGTISGVVRNTSNTPLAGAVVTTTTGGYTATTAADGTYSIANVSPGSYTVNANKFGFRQGTRAITVSGGSTTTADFALVAAIAASNPLTAKSYSNTAFVRLNGMLVTAVFPGDRIYVQNPARSSGIGVAGVSASVGDNVDVTGFMGTVDGERILTLGAIQINSSGSVIKPLRMNNPTIGGTTYGFQPGVTDNAAANKSAVGRNNIGLLVKAAGEVTSVNAGSGHFYIDDGSGLSDGSGSLGVRVNAAGLSLPSVGRIVSVTGISGATVLNSKTIRQLKPRNAADIVRLYPPLTQPTINNSGFEAAMLTGWTSYGSVDGVISGSWFGDITPRTGARFAGTAAHWGTRSGGYYQQFSTVAGQTYRASAYSRIYRGGNISTSCLSRIGIDPTGGTNPASGSIQWSAWDSQPTDYFSVWNLIQAPDVVATGSSMTLFLDFVQTDSPNWHINCFDDVSVMSF